MKVPAHKADSFTRAPPKDVRAVLIYGPNEGLVRERARCVARTLVDDLNDAFRVSELDGRDLKEDPARLLDEAAALSLTGGQRVVCVRNADDPHAHVFESLLAHETAEALVVAEAGGLGPRSALRKLFEAAKNGAALPCYDDDSESMDGLVRTVLKERDVSIDRDAVAWLVSHLGTDRKQIRNELEKLALLAGSAVDEPAHIDLADVVASAGDAGAVNLDNLANAVGLGRLNDIDYGLARATADGMAAISTLRAVARHFQRLHYAAGLVESGASPDDAVSALRPPVFFRDKPAFREQLSRWSAERLGQALIIVMEAELDCKRAELPDLSVCGRALMRVAGAGRAGGRAR